MALAEEAATKLKASGQTVAVAESSTGGLISAALLAVAGASAYYKGGSVIYTLASRRHILGIRREDVADLEPLTEAMVTPFAARARAQIEATWGVAELGIAGPTAVSYGDHASKNESENTLAAGQSVIAVTGPITLTTRVATGHNNREENMWAFTAAALNLLAQAVSDSSATQRD